MSNSIDATLHDAFNLIEDNQLEQARELLEPLLESDASNPAVWWVYAHAVDDPNEGREALNRVLNLDPTYPGASELQTQITRTESETVDDYDDLEFELNDDFAKPITTSRSPVRFGIMALVVILVVVGVFAILSGALGGDPNVSQANTDIPPTDSVVQVVNTDTAEPSITEATETTESITTVLPATEEATETNIPPTETEELLPTETDIPPTNTSEPTPVEPSFTGTLVAALEDYAIDESDVTVRTSSLGETLDVQTCALPGPQSSATLSGIMDILVENNAELPDDIEAVAVTLIDCDNADSIARTIGVSREAVNMLESGEIELKDFQRSWQPLS